MISKEQQWKENWMGESEICWKHPSISPIFFLPQQHMGSLGTELEPVP
jgi:hypothetical protein